MRPSDRSAHAKPNSGAKDGDMHAAGRAPKEIGLPMVAEVMNAAAADEQGAITVIHAKEGQNQPVAVTGAWRLWFEHPPASGSQIQFAVVPPAADTNPDHCFEIHPLTNVGGNDLVTSFHDIKDFKPKDARAAFASYEKLSVTMAATDTGLTLSSAKSGFNYVLFTMRVSGKTTTLKDKGIAVLADVLPDDSVDADVLAQNIRMIFVPGTTPFPQGKALKNGDTLTVLGIPRVNLNAISSFLSKAGSAQVTRKLPYEMIIVALEP